MVEQLVPADLVAVWVAGALGLVALAMLWRSGASLRARIALTVGMIGAVGVLARSHRAPAAERGPRVTEDGGYVGSGACRACHPSEYASWHRTYHRTMTQRAAAPYAITTGSHHMQGYWSEDESGVLRMEPFVYAYDEGRKIPRREAFLEPPDAPQHDVRWSSNCIACHATGGRPNLVDGSAEGGTSHARMRAGHPEVGELGVACEACHGPAAEHVASEQSPLTRWRGGAFAIVNPSRLSRAGASAVCGQCHSYSFPRDEGAFLQTGYVGKFRPGDSLEPSRILLTPKVLESKRVVLDTDTRNLFWPDGTVRVGGREYNGLVLSACYVRGVRGKKISCLSCHSMHRSDPDDQLRKDRSMQDACISCHEMPENHTHHAAGSPGSECVACHMPKISYALRTAIRSHRIDSPRLGDDRPNACNLCHLDKSLAWTNESLTRLWADGPVPVPADATPASARGLLSADAAERVIWADAFGDPAAIAASGRDWEQPLLEAASRDPYAVIRYIAARSLRRYSARATRSLVDQRGIDALVAARDNRDVYVSE